MLLQDLVDIRGRLVMIPHALGIDDHVGAALAAVEAARGVDANVLDAERLDPLAHVIAQFLAAAGTAAAARGPCRAHGGAAEHSVAVKERRSSRRSHQSISPMLEQGTEQVSASTVFGFRVVRAP